MYPFLEFLRRLDKQNPPPDDLAELLRELSHSASSKNDYPRWQLYFGHAQVSKDAAFRLLTRLYEVTSSRNSSRWLTYLISKIENKIKTEAEFTNAYARNYFFRAIMSEQMRILDRELGAHAKVLFSRLKVALPLARGAHNEEVKFDHLLAKESAADLYHYHATGHHQGCAMPTVDELSLLIADALSFDIKEQPLLFWYHLAYAAFRLQFPDQQNLTENQQSDEDEAEYEKADADHMPENDATLHDTTGAADLVEQIYDEIVAAFTALDRGETFPMGKHGSLLVEYWIWKEDYEITLHSYSAQCEVAVATLGERKLRVESTLRNIVMNDPHSTNRHRMAAMKQCFIDLRHLYPYQTGNPHH